METHFDEDVIYFKDLMITFWKHKLSFVIILLMMLTITSIYLYFSTNEYKAKATIMPLQGQRNFTIPFFEKAFEIKEFENILSANLAAYFQDPNVMYLYSIMNSRDFNIRLIEKNNLLTEIFQNQWDQKQKKWLCPKKNKPTSLKKIMYQIIGQPDHCCPPTPIQGAEYIIDHTTIIKNPRKSLFIDIEFIHPSQAFAYKVLSIYLRDLDKYVREKEYVRADANIRYLNEIIQIEKDEEIRKGLLRVRNSQLLIKKYSKGINDFAFQVIDPPIQENTPYKPRRKLTMCLSVAAGVLIWLTIVYFNYILFENKHHQSKEEGQ